MNSRTSKTWLCFACLLLLGAGPEADQPTEFFISHYIEGSSNNKAIGIHNGTGAPVEIAPGVFVPSHDQPWPANELECFEDMLVRIEDGRATAPTDQFGDVAIVADDTRAFREPGMGYPGEFAYGTLWDGNPDVFEINPDGPGLPNVSIPAGSIIQVAEGPLAYSFSSSQIWPTTFTYTPSSDRRAGSGERRQAKIRGGLP